MKTITINVPDDCGAQIVKEKDPVIRTYQDLIDNNVIINEGYWIDEDSKICRTHYFNIIGCSDKNMGASEKVAKSMLAMAMISQLMPYYGGEITDAEWNNSTNNKYTIEKRFGEIYRDAYCSAYCFLAFHTAKQRDEFLKLIEISYKQDIEESLNEQLVKDYLMID